MRALLLVTSLALLSCGAPKPRVQPVAPARSIEFVDDDYPRALAEARRTNKPLFVDVWAPWCHTCLSLRAYVLPKLAPFAERFVWAAIDTEKEQNAAFVAKHPIEAWPTLLVIDPKTEQPVLKWLGAANVDELTLLLEDASAAVEGRGTTDATVAWIEGNRAAAEGRTDDAIAAYRRALTDDPKRRARVVDALVAQLARKDHAACVETARQELPRIAKGTSRGNVALAGLECARALPGQADVGIFVGALESIVGDASDPILADDRSALYEVVVEHHQASNKPRAMELARAWSAFVDGEAARAKTSAERAVFDAHRMLAYFAIGQAERAIPMLQQSEKDFPSDYNPPSRLAKVYLVLGRDDDARAAIDRALRLAYGPRKLRLYSLAADIAHAAGDTTRERATLDEALALGQSLELSPGYRKLLDKLRARRTSLGP